MSPRSISWLALSGALLLSLLLVLSMSYAPPARATARALPLSPRDATDPPTPSPSPTSPDTGTVEATATVPLTFGPTPTDTATATPTPILVHLPYLAQGAAIPTRPVVARLEVEAAGGGRYVLRWSCEGAAAPTFNVFEERLTSPWQQSMIYSGDETSYTVAPTEGDYRFWVDVMAPWLVARSNFVSLHVDATPTPAPPTPTPGLCEPLTCRALSDTSFTWDMTCEQGLYTEHYTTTDNFTWTGSRTYSESGNVYDVSGHLLAGCGHYGCRRELSLTVTGGRLGSNSLHCFSVN